MGLRFVHVFGDDDGETHFADLELPTSAGPGAGPVSYLQVPLVSMGYAEYPADLDEGTPGFHEAPGRSFITPLRGGFETTVTDGESRKFGVGDWVFFDDLATKGHRTVRLPGEARVNLVLRVPDDWAPPPG